MSTAGNSNGLSASWQTRFYTNAIGMSEARKGICEIDAESISLRAGSQSQTITLDTISDITVGPPPKEFSDEFDTVFGIKFTPSENTRLCFIKHHQDHAELFEYELFAEIINGATGVIEYGAVRGGQQTGASSQQVKVAIKPDGVVFKFDEDPRKNVSLGEIVNLQTGARTVGGSKRNVIKIDHMVNETRVTTYLSLIDGRLQQLLNRYMRKEYAQLQEEISEVTVSEAETELVVGYYTTHDIEQTMRALTGGNKNEFESIYEQALDHGLVTHPDEGVGLTQKGMMLANTELEVVNA
jgi:helix-turn-helix protein